MSAHEWAAWLGTSCSHTPTAGCRWLPRPPVVYFLSRRPRGRAGGLLPRGVGTEGMVSAWVGVMPARGVRARACVCACARAWVRGCACACVSLKKCFEKPAPVFGTKLPLDVRPAVWM